MSMLRLTRGDAYVGDRRLSVAVSDADGGALDLDGVELRFAIKRDPDDEESLIAAATGDGIEAGDDPGTARIALEADATAELPVGAWFWELEGTDADGPMTLASGRVQVAADLIRA